MSSYPEANLAYVVSCQTTTGNKGGMYPALYKAVLQGPSPLTFGRTVYDFAKVHHELLGAPEGLSGIVTNGHLLCMAGRQLTIVTPKPGLQLQGKHAMFPITSTHTIEPAERGRAYSVRAGSYVVGADLLDNEQRRVRFAVLFFNTENERPFLSVFWHGRAFDHLVRVSRLMADRKLPDEIPEDLDFMRALVEMPMMREPAGKKRKEN